MDIDRKIERYVEQKLYTKEDLSDNTATIPSILVDILSSGGMVCHCILYFRKRNTKKEEGYYGSNTVRNKIEPSKLIKGAIKALFVGAVDKFGFNWEDFEVKNIKTGKWEIA